MGTHSNVVTYCWTEFDRMGLSSPIPNTTVTPYQILPAKIPNASSFEEGDEIRFRSVGRRIRRPSRASSALAINGSRCRPRCPRRARCSTSSRRSTPSIPSRSPISIRLSSRSPTRFATSNPSRVRRAPSASRCRTRRRSFRSATSRSSISIIGATPIYAQRSFARPPPTRRSACSASPTSRCPCSARIRSPTRWAFSRVRSPS